MKNESIVEKYLEEHFDEWQEKGYIPSQYMEEGVESGKPRRMSGFSYWHQLFNPRQLLFLGLLNKAVSNLANNTKELALGMLMLNRCCDGSSKLSGWQIGKEGSQPTFTNQALNSLHNYCARSSYVLYSSSNISIKNNKLQPVSSVTLKDAKDVNETCDLWITDPPYADAVNYHELTEFFSSWDTLLLKKAFPDWYTDSKRALAIKGVGKDFNESMVEVYTNLANHMSDNGMQVVMFNHNSNTVLEDFKNILTSSGLEIVNTYSIDIENTSNGLKKNKNHYSDVKIYICKKK